MPTMHGTRAGADSLTMKKSFLNLKKNIRHNTGGTEVCLAKPIAWEGYMFSHNGNFSFIYFYTHILPVCTVNI